MVADKYKITDSMKEDWNSRWVDVIKKDWDYDGDFIIRLITHKLELMQEYFTEINSKILNGAFETDQNVTEIIEQLNEVYNLGCKILVSNYGEKADELFKFYGDVRWLVEPVDTPDYKAWVYESDLAEEARKQDIKLFFDLLGNNINNWWV